MDKERIYIKIDDIDQYLQEIDEILPSSSSEYAQDLVKRRALERLLQITIETVMDVSAIMVKELKLGLPYQEEDFLDKISGTVLNPDLVAKLKKMKGFRNVLVHGYSKIDNQRVYEIFTQDLGDITEFKQAVIEFIGRQDE